MITHSVPHLTNEEKLEIKRYSGQLSCAECRRLKVKCNRKVPCSSCVRRGCSKICPNGTMAANRVFRGPRAADDAHLYNKIEEMSRRITELEGALSLLQARVSSEVHPLLQGDLVKIKYTSDVLPLESDTGTEPSSNELPPELESGLGTLAIGEHGARYYGRSGGAESLFTAGEELNDADQTITDYSAPSPDVDKLSNLFPLVESGAWDVPRTLNMLISFLPLRARASALCEVYLEQGCWTGRPIWRHELINDVVAPIYQHHRNTKDTDYDDLDIPDNVTPHKVAILYLVFCLGALMDLTIPAYNAEANQYFKLGRAALTLVSIFDSSEIWTVQALLILAQTHTHGGPQFSSEKTWSLLSLACKLAQKLGLHRESPRWNLDAKVLRRRRALFWELFGLDHYFSLHTGRPPTFRLSQVDCQLPALETDNEDSDFIFHVCKYKFAKEVLSAVADATLATNVPRYQTILDLDKTIREKIHDLHTETSMYSYPTDDFSSPSQYVRLQSRLLVPAIALMQLHRSFFAQALLEHPEDPLASLYAPSFLAAFQSASGMIALCVKLFSRFQELLVRWWTVWNSIFTSAIIVGSIVIHAPQITMASKAFAELNLAVDLFEKGAAHSTRARSGLVVLKRLQRRAMKAISKFQTGGIQPYTEDMVESSICDFGDELTIFAGHTKLMISKSAPRSECQKMKGGPRQNSPTSVPQEHALPASRPLDTSTGGIKQPHREPVPLPPSQTTNTSMSSQQEWSQAQFAPQLSGAAFLYGTSLQAHMEIDSGQYHQEQLSPDHGQNYSYHDQISPADLGMGLAGESGMDAQWISFMMESGILHGDGNLSGNQYLA